MPEKQVSTRYDCRLTKKDFDYIKTNTSKVLTALLNVQKIYKGRLFIKKFRTSEASVNALRSHLTQLEVEKNFRPDLIIIDYADLMQPRRNYSDKRFELESIYLDIRDLADEYHCPVWTASQSTRSSVDKKVITIADLAEAFNKAMIADFMVALCQTVEEKADGNMRFYVSKNRTGIANVTLDGDIDYPTATMMCYELQSQ